MQAFPLPSPSAVDCAYVSVFAAIWGTLALAALLGHMPLARVATQYTYYKSYARYFLLSEYVEDHLAHRPEGPNGDMDLAWRCCDIFVRQAQSKDEQAWAQALVQQFSRHVAAAGASSAGRPTPGCQSSLVAS